MQTESHPLALIYSGPTVESGRMDAYEVAASIIAFGDYLSVIAKTVYGETIRVKTDVYGFRRGSFIINFTLDVAGVLLTFFSGPLGPKDMLELIKHSVQTWQHLKGEPPKSIQVEGDNVRIENESGVVQYFRAETVNIITSEKAGEAAKRFIGSPLESGVDKVVIATEREEIVEILQKDANCFLPVSVDTPLFEHTIKIGLIIESAVFKEGNMWRFWDGQNSFLAPIDDKEFLARVDNGQERFGKGDILIVDLQIKQAKIPGSLKTERRIRKIHEHTVAKQGNLF